MNSIILAGGCFWGMEELLRAVPGVIDTEVGYIGGKNENPTYDFHPGHAEAVKINFDPTQTSYMKLLDFFFCIHDPTTLNRQGNDMGTSYRSAIFPASVEEKAIAEAMIKTVNDSGFWNAPVVTTIEMGHTFWPAEQYHQDYLQKNPNGYTCHYVRHTTYLR